MIGDACLFTPRRPLSLRYSPEQKGAYDENQYDDEEEDGDNDNNNDDDNDNNNGNDDDNDNDNDDDKVIMAKNLKKARHGQQVTAPKWSPVAVFAWSKIF